MKNKSAAMLSEALTLIRSHLDDASRAETHVMLFTSNRVLYFCRKNLVDGNLERFPREMVILRLLCPRLFN